MSVKFNTSVPFSSKLVLKIKSTSIFLKPSVENNPIMLNSMVWKKFVNFDAFAPLGLD